MSSMIKHLFATTALIIPVSIASTSPANALQNDQAIEWTAGTGTGQITVPTAQVDPSNGSIPAALQRWRTLSASGNYSFGEYAGFLMTYPDWPGSNGMRKNAEQAIDLNSYSPSQTVAYFDRLPPVTNTGRAKYAIALHASGDKDKAALWGQKAWRGGPLTDDDEARLLSIMAGKLTPDDHDARVDKLLWAKATRAAERTLPYTSPQRRPLFAARLAIKSKSPEADSLLTNAGAAAGADAGVLAERAMSLRSSGSGWTAREMLANRSALAVPPTDAEEWYEVLLTLAREAENDGQYDTAYKIASKVDDGIPAGVAVVEQELGVRDDYTSLTWLAGMTAYFKLNRPQDAIGMFDRYGKAAKSPQTRTKGLYWAGAAAKKAGQTELANAYFDEAAEYVDQFYGQLSNEALGRRLPKVITGAQIPAVPTKNDSSVFQAARLAGTLGSHQEQSLFLRAIANGAESEADYIDAISLSRAIGRPDLAVMAGRNARVDSHSNLIAHAFPVISIPPEERDNFTLIHAITRQESQFDREAISHAGARGLMQLMPGTARETSGRISMSYSRAALTTDTDYNIRLGSTYIKSMLRYYGGSYPLAVAAYNAGPGNVNKWLRANGDPRTGQIGILEWIERIPIYETKNYVQRVLENAVMYDLQNPDRAEVTATMPLSVYLGKSAPG
ncbi:lytic transglycosylase domain-containing protein [Sphingorhabdus arenilitoris]|uniref:Lytic transglycosylase domain-containing protein n=1 Tax=Sphingorhabdus arenilitoris TaxID=1490041 RepID=A0ABV8RHA2_9SPHN